MKYDMQSVYPILEYRASLCLSLGMGKLFY